MRRELLGVVVALASLVGLVPAAGAAPGVDPAVVRTEAGAVRGSVAEGVRRFQRVPFAAPPVGALRWRAPRPVVPWAGVREASGEPVMCAQAVPNQVFSTNEDCLYVNVTAPSTPGPHPVLVWLHGGAFSLGSGGVYDPARLVRSGDVVVVTVNYRLGVFGYFGHPALGADSGAYGLLDQLAALRWVRRNVRAFGGDPRAVTVAGESAGGLSICAMLTTQAAAGLFRRAVVQSGACSMSWPENGIAPGVPAGSPYLPVDQVRDKGERLVAEQGCRDLDCLRKKEPSALFGTGGLVHRFQQLAYGGPVLPRRPVDALRDGRVLPVPVLIGGNQDEARLFAGYFEAVDEARYRELLAAAFREQAGQVLARYPVSAHGTPIAAWAAVLTDRVWACPALETARLLRAVAPTHAYEFADRSAPLNLGVVPPPGLPSLGAYHGAELGYLFDSVTTGTLTTPAQQALSAEMIGDWAAFTRGERLPWPRFPAVRQFGGPRADHQCGFWAGITA
ncbi:para-nitrobenzyl esterase [Crossiella equi]|uniref:Carboxylic ester hydrolase n=1 Tax=Crossiella equi TaxID=130796 RepID=A0ABS5AT35_9PSEU|nr:carboxylesterase family protein [Crossiella equi]MBP2479364.1 para-nitrobenzyl esterase [Crossiella equi]